MLLLSFTMVPKNKTDFFKRAWKIFVRLHLQFQCVPCMKPLMFQRQTQRVQRGLGSWSFQVEGKVATVHRWLWNLSCSRVPLFALYDRKLKKLNQHNQTINLFDWTLSRHNSRFHQFLHDQAQDWMRFNSARILLNLKFTTTSLSKLPHKIANVYWCIDEMLLIAVDHFVMRQVNMNRIVDVFKLWVVKKFAYLIFSKKFFSPVPIGHLLEPSHCFVWF